MVIEHTVRPAPNQGAPGDATGFALAPTSYKNELDHKHNTDNFSKSIQKRRWHLRYVQSNNNTQVEVDMHRDSVPFQLSSSNHIYLVDNCTISLPVLQTL